jgi:hypothetical protein
MSPARLFSLILLLLVSACVDTVTDPLIAPDVPRSAISDALHGADGNPHFYWLPPMVAQPPSRLLRRFEHLASPRVVVVCLESNQLADCDGDAPVESAAAPGVIADFSLSAGLVREDDHFKVEFDTGAFGLQASSDDGTFQTTYRIVVYTDPLEELGGPFVLGHADFVVGASGRAARNLATGDVIGLLDGRTLAIRFRIDQGAYAHALGVNLARAVGDPEDTELCQEHCSVTIIDPTETTVASLDDGMGAAVTAIQFLPGDLPGPAVLVIDERATEGDDPNCATGVLVEKRYCYRYRIIPDVEFTRPVRFGICPRDLPINEDRRWRIHKVDYQDGVPLLTYPEEVDVSDFLPCSHEAGIAFLGRLLRFASDWLVPPLFAQTTVRTWGGMAQDLSDLFWGRARDDDSPSFTRGSAGTNHVCMLAGDGSAYCWGNNSLGQLGNGTTTRSALPVPVAGGLSFQGISSGYHYTCGWTRGGSGYCWGDGSGGALGTGTTDGSLVPAAVTGGHTFAEIDVGPYHACGRTPEGVVYCWGYNAHGRLGTGATTSISAVPQPVVGGLMFRSITVGLSNACGLTPDGTAYCWGWGTRGALGTGDTEHRTAPTAVATEIKFASLIAGTNTTCGIAIRGPTYCWGENYFGSLGGGITTSYQQLLPAEVSGFLNFSAAGPGDSQSYVTPSCGIDGAGNGYCWGANAFGALGTTEPTETCELPSGGHTFTCTGNPTAVQGGLRFKAIYPAGGFTCAITLANEPYCWGVNSDGQLGTGGQAPDTCNARGWDEPCSFVPLRVGAGR